MLPWKGYEDKWVNHFQKDSLGEVFTYVLQDSDVAAHQSVKLYHPKPEALKEGAKKLHARNFLIIMGRAGKMPVDFCVGWPKVNQWGKMGGTGFGLTICNRRNIPIRDLEFSEIAEAAKNWISDQLTTQKAA
jgi:hypothetical protein